MRLLLLGLLALFGTPVAACQFDTDCSPGSRCAKQGASLYGVCRSGINPGNSYDRKPARDPLDINRSHGNTCTFDVDCGPGSRCAKDGGGVNGVCLKRGFTDDNERPRFGRDSDGGGACSWDTECGLGNRCAKAPGQLQGVCRKR